MLRADQVMNHFEDLTTWEAALILLLSIIGGVSALLWAFWLS